MEHRHVLRQASVNGHLVRSLNSPVDPEDQREPEDTTDRNAYPDDDISVSGAAGTGIIDGTLRIGDIIGCGKREGGVDLSGELSPNTRLVV